MKFYKIVLFLTIIFSFTGSRSLCAKSLHIKFSGEDYQILQNTTKPLYFNKKESVKAFNEKLNVTLSNHPLFKKVQNIAKEIAKNRSTNSSASRNINSILDVTLSSNAIERMIKNCVSRRVRKGNNLSLEAKILLCSCYPHADQRDHVLITDNQNVNKLILLHSCDISEMPSMLAASPCDNKEKISLASQGTSDFISNQLEYCRDSDAFEVVNSKCYDKCPSHSPYDQNSGSCVDICGASVFGKKTAVTLPIRKRQMSSSAQNSFMYGIGDSKLINSTDEIAKRHSDSEMGSFLSKEDNAMFLKNDIDMRKENVDHYESLGFKEVSSKNQCFKCPSQTKEIKNNKCLDSHGCDLAQEVYSKEKKKCQDRCEEGEVNDKLGECVLGECKDCLLGYHMINSRMHSLRSRFERANGISSEQNYVDERSCKLAPHAKEEMRIIEMIFDSLESSISSNYGDEIVSPIPNQSGIVSVEDTNRLIDNACKKNSSKTTSCKSDLLQLTEEIEDLELSMCTDDCKKDEFKLNIATTSDENGNPNFCYSLDCSPCADNLELVQKNTNTSLSDMNITTLNGCSSQDWVSSRRQVMFDKMREAERLLSSCQRNPSSAVQICSSFNSEVTEDEIYGLLRDDPLRNCLKD